MSEYCESKQERLAEIKGTEGIHTYACARMYIHVYIGHIYTLCCQGGLYSIIWIIQEQYIVQEPYFDAEIVDLHMKWQYNICQFY